MERGFGVPGVCDHGVLGAELATRAGPKMSRPRWVSLGVATCDVGRQVEAEEEADGDRAIWQRSSFCMAGLLVWLLEHYMIQFKGK